MSIMEIGDFTVWGDPETMTTTVSVDGRTEQVTQTVGEMLEILGRYVTRLQDENAKLRELLSSYWKRTHSPVSPNVERDYLLEMRSLGIEVDE